MPNNYFQFKEFKVTQQSAAMKVTTEGCLFGAWVADYLSVSKNNRPSPFYCLDIGAGTGLLSLMVAQKNEDVFIDAIELVPETAEEARQNVTESKWSEMIRVSTDDVLKFRHECNKQYDFIFSNPPFFEKDLVSIHQARNIAMHSVALNLEELLNSVNMLLSPFGTCAVLIPAVRAKQFIEMAANVGLFVLYTLTIMQTEKHDAFRVFYILVREATLPQMSEMFIKIENQYSPSFKKLLKDYYLNL